MSNQNTLPVIVEGENFILYAEKAMYWESRKILFVADLHLGKAAHFRKQGIPVPCQVAANNFKMLDLIIKKSNCNKLVFLGDLFHSAHNQECQSFIEWRNLHAHIDMSLVIGNHDILENNFYEAARLTLVDYLCINPFIFTHKPIENEYTDYYNIAGHVHPGVRLHGKARQSVSLACFYFGKGYALMPSFGSFTGTKIISVCKEDMIYVITNNEVRKIL